MTKTERHKKKEREAESGGEEDRRERSRGAEQREVRERSSKTWKESERQLTDSKARREKEEIVLRGKKESVSMATVDALHDILCARSERTAAQKPSRGRETEA